MAILITGGAGYIGSHTCVELLNNGYELIIIDNLSNSSRKSIDRIAQLSNNNFKFYEGDLLDKIFLENIFKNNRVNSIILKYIF